MKIAILSKGSDYSDLIGDDVSNSQCLFVFDCETLQYDVLRNPLVLSEKMQNNIEFILLLIKGQVSSILVQTCPVDLKKMLEERGISVIESFRGTIGDAVSQLKKQSLEDTHIIPIEDITRENTTALKC
ncbi:MAG: NifB/NifX family molybdenum-iron cluster-binding protein [Planctomycetota bacterium]|jgi:predicted Fe-Mo cluster-binding NifX family protein